MRLGFDTSFLVAAVLESHHHHARCRPWIRAVNSREVEARVSWHAVAEIWSVLTRLPVPLRLEPATATRVVDRLVEVFQPLEISGEAYRAAVRRCSERGLRSGAIFDALHLAVAEAERVDVFVTFNGGDFARLRSAGSPKIVLPPDPPSFDV